MTSKLTITDERLAELVAFKPLPGTDITSATRDEWMAMAAELQERRKAEKNCEPVAYMTYKGYLLHAGDPKLAEFSEPTPLYADPRLAAMPAAPVAWLWSRDDDDADAADAIECGWTASPLYRHAQPAPADKNPLLEFAREYIESWELGMPGDSSLLASARKAIADSEIPQPAPVVPDERAAFNAWNNEDNLPIAGVGAKNAAWLAWQARASLCGNSVLDVPPERPADSSSGDDVEAWFDEGWNACRAAMLQGAENTESRCGIQTAPALDSLPKNAESRCGNSPVIPDGSAAMLRRWLAFGRGMQNAGSQLPHNLIAETESMLAAAPQEVNHG